MDTTEYLVFSGGGSNGFTHVGVWRVLEALCLRQRGIDLCRAVRGVSGTSIGAIVALAIALGYTSYEFEEMASHYIDLSNDSLDLMKLYQGRKGVVNSDVIGGFVQRLIEKKTGSTELRFGDLPVKYLCAVHNITKMEGELMSAETQPELEVWRAVTMSCLLPFVFEGLRHPATGDVYMDGGLSNSLPFECFPVEKTLALYIRKDPGGDTSSFIGLFARVMQAYETATKMKLKATPRLQIVNVSVATSATEQIISSGKLRVDLVDRERLVRTGEMAALDAYRPDLAQFVTAFKKVWICGEKKQT